MKLILEINKPVGTTDSDLMAMALYKFMGQRIFDDVLSKFKFEEFDVIDIKIED